MVKVFVILFACSLFAILLCVDRINESQQSCTRLTDTEFELVHNFRKFQKDTDGVGPILHPPYVACINGITGELEPRCRLMEFQPIWCGEYELVFEDGKKFVVKSHELTMAFQDGDRYFYHRKAKPVEELHLR